MQNPFCAGGRARWRLLEALPAAKRAHLVESDCEAERSAAERGVVNALRTGDLRTQKVPHVPRRLTVPDTLFYLSPACGEVYYLPLTIRALANCRRTSPALVEQKIYYLPTAAERVERLVDEHLDAAQTAANPTALSTPLTIALGCAAFVAQYGDSLDRYGIQASALTFSSPSPRPQLMLSAPASCPQDAGTRRKLKHCQMLPERLKYAGGVIYYTVLNAATAAELCTDLCKVLRAGGRRWRMAFHQVVERRFPFVAESQTGLHQFMVESSQERRF